MRGAGACSSDVDEQRPAVVQATTSASLPTGGLPHNETIERQACTTRLLLDHVHSPVVPAVSLSRAVSCPADTVRIVTGPLTTW